MFEKLNFKLSALIDIYSAPTLKSEVKGGWKTIWKSDSNALLIFIGRESYITVAVLPGPLY